MAHTFIAYIDEAGDDGLNNGYREPGKGGGPSHWLTIGSVIWRASRDLDAVQWAKDIIAALPPQRRDKILHFAKLDHAQRVMAVSHLCGKPFRSISILANKPIIPEGTYVQKNQFYFYMCRYLIERISWLCRDFRRYAPEGDGTVKIVFARRRGMSYRDFQAYMQGLKILPTQKFVFIGLLLIFQRLKHSIKSSDMAFN